MLRIFGRENRGRQRAFAALAVACALLCFPAAAQSGAQADSLAPNGIKIGDGRLHPYLDIEGRIDSQAISDTAGTGYLPELIFNFRGGLRFDLSTPSTLLNFNGNAGAAWYTGALTGGASTTASHFQTDVGLNAAFNRDGAIEFQIGDQLYRGPKGSSPDALVGVLSLRNAAYVAAPIHPGGKGLEITPRVNWGVEFFTPQTACPTILPNCEQIIRELNSNDLNFGLNGKWRFLPKTAITIDLDFGWRSYFNSTVHPQATLLKGLAGLTGLITSKLALVLMAGGGGDFRSGIATFIATGEVAWTPFDQVRLRAGYVRTLQPVASTGLYGDDRPYIAANMTFFRRLGIAVTGSFDWLTFYGPVAGGALVIAREDYLISADVSPSVIITSWFNVGASYILSVRGNARGAPAGFVPYTRHEGILRLTFQY